MTTIVTVPPEPFMTPADIPGSHASNDATVAAYIAAAVEQIDGPTGWVGRAFGPQTLQTWIWYPSCGVVYLPCPPVISLVSMTYLDSLGTEQSVDISNVTLDKLSGALRMPAGSWAAAAGYPGGIKVNYTAGYNGVSPGTGGTGSIPASVKQAVRFMVQDTIANAAETSTLKAYEVEGLGRKEFFVSRADSKTLRASVEGFLAGLVIYR